MPSPADAPPARRIDPGLIIAIVVGCIVGAFVVHRAATTMPPKARSGIASRLPNSIAIEEHPANTLTATGEAWSVAFAPDGKSLLVGDRQGITVWDPETGKTLRTLDTKGDGARSLALTHSGSYAVMAVAYGDIVRVVPTAAGAGSGIVLRDVGKMPQAVAIAPDDSLIAATAADGKIRIWEGGSALTPSEPGRVYDTTQAGGADAARLRPRRTLDGPAQPNGVAFSPDGKQIAVSGEKAVVLLDPTTGAEVRRLTPGKPNGTGTLRGVRFSPDGTRIVAIAEDAGNGTAGKVVAWDAASGTVTHQSDAVAGEGLSSSYGPRGMTQLAFSPDGTLLASAHRDGTVIVRNSTTLRPQRLLNAGGREIFSIAFSPDGKTLAAGSRDGSVTLWQVKK